MVDTAILKPLIGFFLAIAAIGGGILLWKAVKWAFSRLKDIKTGGDDGSKTDRDIDR